MLLIVINLDPHYIFLALQSPPSFKIFKKFLVFLTLRKNISNICSIVVADNPELSCWITHWVCLGLLILLGCSNSLLVRGVYIDAEEPSGKCVVFPCYYLRVLFQEERIKKTNPKVQLEGVNSSKPETDGTKGGHEINHISAVEQPEQNCKQNHRTAM